MFVSQKKRDWRLTKKSLRDTIPRKKTGFASKSPVILANLLIIQAGPEHCWLAPQYSHQNELMCGHRVDGGETGVQIKLSQTNVLKQTETWDQQHGGSRCEPVSQISFIIVLPARDINFGNIYIPPDYLILFQLSEQNTEQ